jgi:hypothetical protein
MLSSFFWQNFDRYSGVKKIGGKRVSAEKLGSKVFRLRIRGATKALPTTKTAVHMSQQRKFKSMEATENKTTSGGLFDTTVASWNQDCN